LRLFAGLLLLLLSFAGGPVAATGKRVSERPWRMVIPSIGLESQVEAVGFRERGGQLEWGTSEWAVAYHKGTALPGEIGNAVFSGHNASRGTGVFRALYRATVGDQITLYVGEVALEYQIVERHVMRELLAGAEMRRQNATWAGPFPDERITLVTCHPTWTNTHRLVIVARPLPRLTPLIAPGLVVLPETVAQPLSSIPATWPDVFVTLPPGAIPP
jgi:LPXTG-site transpeptidase (sortase) family protein